MSEPSTCANPYCDRTATIAVQFFGRTVGHVCDPCHQGLSVAIRTDRDQPFGALLQPDAELLRFAMPVPVHLPQTDAERDDLVEMIRQKVADAAETELRRKWDDT